MAGFDTGKAFVFNKASKFSPLGILNRANRGLIGQNQQTVLGCGHTKGRKITAARFNRVTGAILQPVKQHDAVFKVAQRSTAEFLTVFGPYFDGVPSFGLKFGWFQPKLMG